MIHYWRAFDTLKEALQFMTRTYYDYPREGYDTRLRIVYPEQDGDKYVIAGCRYASCD